MSGQVQKGVKQAKAALARHGIREGKVLTSRDRGMDKVKNDLKRDNMPDGVQSWQLPVMLHSDQHVVGFITVGAPGSKVPKHKHTKASLFRIIISGSVLLGTKELTSGDWMFVPAGVEYEMTAGPTGYVSMHKYAMIGGGDDDDVRKRRRRPRVRKTASR